MNRLVRCAAAASLATLGLLACAGWQRGPARVADPITADELLAHVRFLADDRLEGRMTGERGCELAAQYIAERFAASGLEPGGDMGPAGRTYLQHFVATSGRKVEPTTTLNFGGRELALDQEFAVALGMGTAAGEGSVVFAGYGIRSTDPARDDYAGVDVAGKVVVVVSGAPGRATGTGDFLDTKPAGRAARTRSKIETAFRLKAAALIVIQNPLESATAETLPAWESDRGEGLTFPAAHVRASLGRELLATAGVDLDAAIAKCEQGVIAAQTLENVQVKLRVDTAPIRRPTANVVGVIRGTANRGDIPSEDHLIVGAHYDHLGYGDASSLSGDHAIHNGADDNASGTAAMLEVAQHVATGPKPARSVVCIAFSGEELGLLGSQHYAQSPLLPLASCFAMLNMDMVGRSKNDYCAVGAIGSAAAFKGMAEEANTALALGLKLECSDGGMSQGSSDHQSFLNAQVPSLFFFSGLHEDYHKPSDDADKINGDGAARIAKLCDGVLERLEALKQKPQFVAIAAPPSNPHGANPTATSPGAGDPAAPRPTTRPWFGSIPSFGESIDGVVFDGVSKGSPAEKAGLQKGDKLIEWNGRAVKTLEDFTTLLSAAQVGDTVKVVIQRGDLEIDYSITLVLRP